MKDLYKGRAKRLAKKLASGFDTAHALREIRYIKAMRLLKQIAKAAAKKR